MQKDCGENQSTDSILTKITNRKTAHTVKLKKKKFLKSFLKLLLLLGLFALAALFYKDSISEIIWGIKELSIWQIVISGLISCVFFLVEGHIIYIMANPYESSYRWIKGIKTAYLCEFYRILTLGSGSGVAAIYYLQRDGICAACGTGITMLQFVIKKIGVMILGLAGFLSLMCRQRTASVLTDYYRVMITGCIITMVIVVSMSAVTLSSKVKGLLVMLINRAEVKFPKQYDRLEKWRKSLILLNATGQDILRHKGRFMQVLADNLLKLIVIYMIPAYITVGKSNLSFVENVLLMSVCYMLAGVIPAPSGIGSLEFVFLLFFKHFIPENVSIPAILVFRFVTWIVPFFIGALIFFINKVKLRTNT